MSKVDTNASSASAETANNEMVPAITLSDLIKLQKEGNWDEIKSLIQQGQLSLIPTLNLEELLTSKANLTSILIFIDALQKSLAPLSLKTNDLKAYFDKDSEGVQKLKLKKIAMEALPALTAFGFSDSFNMPLVNIFKDNIEIEHLMKLDIEELKKALEKSGINFSSTIHLLQEIGVLKNSNNNTDSKLKVLHT